MQIDIIRPGAWAERIVSYARAPIGRYLRDNIRWGHVFQGVERHIKLPAMHLMILDHIRDENQIS